MSTASDFIQSIESEVPKTHRELLQRARLTAAELAELNRVQDTRAGFDFAVTVALILIVPVLYAALPSPLTAVACVLLMIRNFNSCANFVHASDHGSLFSNARSNNIFGSVAANICGYTLTGHKLAHQMHHQNLNTKDDADRIWGEPEERVRDVFVMWLSDIFLISAVKRLLQYSQSEKKGYRSSPWKNLNAAFLLNASRVMLPVVVIQAAILTYYSFVLGPQYYILFHVLPIMTLYPAQIRMRSFVEHSFDVGYVPQQPDETWVTRSVDAGWLERAIIAPNYSVYHFEHHLLPGVPYYNFPKVREILARNGFQPPLAPGYFRFLWQKWRAENALAVSR